MRQFDYFSLTLTIDTVCSILNLAPARAGGEEYSSEGMRLAPVDFASVS